MLLFLYNTFVGIFTVQKLQIAFGDYILLDDLNFEIYEKDRVGIVGTNGCGKSTLLEVLLGYRENFTGEALKNDKVTYGYMAQNSGLISDNTVSQEFLLPYQHLIDLENRIRKLEQSLTADSSNELTAMYDQFNKQGGTYFRSRINSILSGLGFPPDIREISISSLSGGQRTRLALARLLEADPDVMILDEPTNHLDLESLAWLEGFLADYTGTLIVISHDRHFLDEVTAKTLYLHSHTGKMYRGSYSKSRELFQAECKRETKLSGVKYRGEKAIRVNFAVNEPGGKDVLTVKNLSYGFDGKMLFENLSFEIKHGQRVLLKGPNGCGKSSLLKILTGRLPAQSGSFRFGEGIKYSYYAQDLSELHDHLTVFDEIWQHVNRGRQGNDILDQTAIRTALGAFGFTGEDVFKKIASLSGGEKARVALLKITYERSNLLILDEPTNHLDVATREVIEDALSRYEGTLLIVSHDRYFTEKIIDRVIELEQKSGQQEAVTAESEPSEAKNDYLEKKERRSQERRRKTLQDKLIKEMEDLGRLIKDIDAQLVDPSLASDYQKLSELCTKKEEAASKLSQVEEDYLETELI